MAKRKATRRTRKATGKRTKRSAARPVRRTTAKKATRSKAKASRSKAKASARRVRRKPARAASRPATARAAKPAKVARPSKPVRTETRPKPVFLNRERRMLRDDETLASAPSTLGYAPKASGAESGHQKYNHRVREDTQGGPALTGGDMDTDWNDAYASGEETPGGDMPTPDQDVVEEIGRALGVEYEDAEELKGAPKIEERDRHRWEYDPASAEDYKDRNRRDED
jgi:hypothetical protein